MITPQQHHCLIASFGVEVALSDLRDFRKVASGNGLFECCFGFDTKSQLIDFSTSRRQLTDHLSSMGRRFERLEKRLDKVERGLEREARSLISLPAEPVEPPGGLAESGEGETSGAVTRVSGARERASRSTRSRRLDPMASHNARVAEAVSAIEEEAGPTSATSEERPEAAVVAPSALAEESRVEPEARAAESAAGTGVKPYPTGGGLPVWPLYPLAILACYLLWRGQRGEKVDRGALPGPRQP